MLSKSSSNPEAQIFMLQEYRDLFLIGKNTLTVMIPILINKDVFESSYNDLKFTVQNCNYFWTNLTEGEKWKQWQILFSWAPKSLRMVTVATKLKDACSLERKLWQT